MMRLLLVALTALAGCGTSPPARLYMLSVAAAPDGLLRTALAVAVGPVSVPAAVDRPQIVVQDGPNRVALQEFDRWAAPLNDGIARAVAGNLSVLLGTPRVAATALPGFDPAYRVRIAVERFEAVPGGVVSVEALWVVEPASGRRATSGRTVTSEAVDGADLTAMVAAESRALVVVSADIAAAIRAAAR